jgi:hypothetical protein
MASSGKYQRKGAAIFCRLKGDSKEWDAASSTFSALGTLLTACGEDFQKFEILLKPESEKLFPSATFV